MGLLDATGNRRRLTRGFRGELLTRSLSSRGFTGCLLRTGHVVGVAGEGSDGIWRDNEVKCVLGCCSRLT